MKKYNVFLINFIILEPYWLFKILKKIFLDLPIE